MGAADNAVNLGGSKSLHRQLPETGMNSHVCKTGEIIPLRNFLLQELNKVDLCLFFLQFQRYYVIQMLPIWLLNRNPVPFWKHFYGFIRHISIHNRVFFLFLPESIAIVKINCTLRRKKMSFASETPSLYLNDNLNWLQWVYPLARRRFPDGWKSQCSNSHLKNHLYKR